VRFGVNSVLLGATLLAVGNSLGDLFNNSSLASQGFAVMACTGTISGQLFNLLIGFGLSLFRQTLQLRKAGKVVAGDRSCSSSTCSARRPPKRRPRRSSR
jgi:sodium/potassium/calcium exchanger 6